ncbi:MAG: YciI family protein [Weeksellaceae bacterium]|nr:YciI family protein [Weeksellaceae bacterium]
MKAVLFYETAEHVTMERIMEVYPRHAAVVEEFSRQGKILGIGPYGNPGEGSMGIFTDKESAEEFTKKDPFVLEGIVSTVTLREWNDSLLE